MWSVLFYDFFKDKAECFCLDQNDNKFNFSSEQTTKIDAELGIREALWLNDIIVSGVHWLSDYDKEDFRAVATIKEMRKLYPGNFCRLMVQVEKKTGNNCWFIDASNYLSYDKERGSYSMSLSNSRNKREVEICSPHVKKVVLNTGWFELDVAKLLSEWVQPEQVAMNCQFRSSKNENGPTLNEIDIIVIVHGKLLFVECKTQVKDATDVDKFNNAIRNYGGLSAKGVFFTDVTMKPQAKAKCEKANILTFNMQEIKNAGDTGKEDLFRKLDRHIGGLNIR